MDFFGLPTGGHLKNTNKLSELSENLNKKCISHANRQARLDIDSVKGRDAFGLEESSSKIIQAKHSEHQCFKPYLDSWNLDGIKNLDDRFKYYTLIEKQDIKDTEKVQEFKEAMSCMIKLGSTKFSDTMKVFEKDGINAGAAYAHEVNQHKILQRLAQVHPVLVNQKPLEGLEYLKEVARDPAIMKYIDQAISEGKNLNNYSDKAAYTLEDVAKARDSLEKNTELNIDHTKSGNDFERH